MKRIVLILMVVVSLAACAGNGAVRKHMSEDLGSQEKTALLRERVNEFWSAFKNADYARIYELYDPFFQAKTDKNTFIGSLGKLTYQDYEILDASVQGNIGTVKMKVVYSLGVVRVQTQEFSVTEETGEFDEQWLYVYDNWYKEYRLSSLEYSIAEY